MIEALIWGATTGVLFLLVAGLRRVPWSYAGLFALGIGTVFTTVRLSQLNVGLDPGSLVLLAAVGGSLASAGWERGAHARARRAASILEARA